MSSHRISHATEAKQRLSLDRLLRPESIAIVGANADPQTIGGSMLANLRRFAFGGQIHLVSRSRKEIDGMPCVGSVDDLPMGVDVAVLIVPQLALRENVKACIDRRVGAIIAFSAGFAEAGEAGRQEQDAISEICAEAGVVLLGPNCMGLTNYTDAVPLTFEPVHPLPADDGQGRKVAVIAQSGATAANIRFAMQARELPLSLVVSTGNEALLGAEDFLERLIDDPSTGVIALYLEQIRRPARFIEAARQARLKNIPIVMLHPGSSERAKVAAQSHTGALAGDYEVMRCVARSEAVVFAETTEELFDLTAILLRFPRPLAGGAAIATNSGAVRSLALDFSQQIGLPLADLVPGTHGALSALLPDYIHIDNPLDIGVAGFLDAGIFGTSTRALLDDETVSSVLLVLAGGSASQQMAKARAIVPVADQSDKPLLLCILGDDYGLDAAFMKLLRQSRIPFFRSPERAMRALAALDRHARDLLATSARSERTPIRLEVQRDGALAESDAKAMLASIGIRTPQGAVAATVEDAVAAAERIGYPVVLKVHSAEIAHKSDIGGVVVGLRDAQALRDAWAKIQASARAAYPEVGLDGLLVEAMAAPGLEMVVGARRDPQWGPVVLVGMGGVWIEALNDATLLAADAGHEQIVDAITSLRAAKLLGPFRGQPARDVDAVAKAVGTLGAVMRGTPDLAEVDINPLIVYGEGDGAIAVDALFVGKADI